MFDVDIECQKCGACCHSTIPVITHHDIRRIAEFTDMAPSEFVTTYSKRTISIDSDYKGWVLMTSGRRILGLKQNGDRCLFLSARMRCSTYEVRPVVCRMYPFVAELNGRGEIGALGFHEKASHNGMVCTALARFVKSGGTLARDTRQEDTEDKSYRRRCAEWNRSDWPKTLRRFLAFMGF